MKVKIEKGSKLARLGHITRKVWCGENVWEGRQHTLRQGNAMNSFLKKPHTKEEKTKQKQLALLPRDEAYIY